MSVDTSITIGVGFIVDPDGFLEYCDRTDPDQNYYGEEHFENLNANMSLLTCVTSGSYMTDEQMSYVIAIKRLTKSYDAWALPTGVVGFKTPNVELEEELALYRVAAEVGTRCPVVTQFMSVLVH